MQMGVSSVSWAGGFTGGDGQSYVSAIDDAQEAIEFARLNQLEGIYNLVDDSQLTLREQVERVCYKYGLPSVYWDSSQFNRRGNRCTPQTRGRDRPARRLDRQPDTHRDPGTGPLPPSES